MSEELSPDRRPVSPRLATTRVSFRGLPNDGWRDVYHHLLTMPLWAFLSVMALGFLVINTTFAAIYALDPGGISGARPGNLLDHFFFSVETLGTLGYGVMAPRDLFCNLVMTAEVFVGIFNLAIATGVLFARISRPTARIMFSNVAVVTQHEGAPTLLFRAANRRRNLVVEAEVSVSLLRDVVTAEGATLRRWYEMPVIRARSPLFTLTWSVMHPIDEASPLYGQTRESLRAQKAEILVVMKGLDETFASTIHARGSYSPDQIHWGRNLADMFGVDEEGRRTINFAHFHRLV